MKIFDKVFVVTGAGSGIGRAITLNLLNKGASVAAVDLNSETLKETSEIAGDKSAKLSTHVVNVADKKAIEALPEAVVAKHGAIDAIINNAGIIQPFKRLNDLDYEVIDRVMQVNFYGQLYMIKTFLPHLLKRPEGHITNISSMGGFFPFPGQTIYGASKAAVKLMSEGLNSELTETNVNVSVVFPGATETNINTNSGLEATEQETESNIPVTSPENAAETIVSGMEKNKYHIYVGNDSKIMNLLIKLMPKKAANLIYNQMKFLLED